MNEILASAGNNLASPIILSFVLGFLAAIVRSDLTIPEAMAKALSIYLLFAIGFKGGVSVASNEFDIGVLLALLAGTLLSLLLPVIAFALLKAITPLDNLNAAAVAGHYGSISIVTFVAATSALEIYGIAAEGYMVAVAAAMEAPAIVTALWLASRGDDNSRMEPDLWREILLNGSIVLLVGSFFIGWITGEEGLEEISSFIVAPSGDVVLRYRRLISMFAPSPHDVWDAYLDKYGLESVFPVAKTEIGNLAAIASEEILYPEIARALALRGAEIFCHSSSEVGSPIATNKDFAKLARAFENLAYVVSANTAGISGTAMPLSSAEGNSQVVDWKGRVVAQSGDGETFTAFSTIDLGSLREGRRTPAMTNYLARQRPALWAEAYSAAADNFAQEDMVQDGKPSIPERDYFRRRQADLIERLDKAGII